MSKDLEDALVLTAQALRDNTAALNALYDLFMERGGVKTAPTAPTEAPAPAPVQPKDAPITIEEVQAALVKVAKDVGRDAAAEVLLAHGANKLPDLKSSEYASVVDACEGRLVACAAQCVGGSS